MDSARTLQYALRRRSVGVVRASGTGTEKETASDSEPVEAEGPVGRLSTRYPPSLVPPTLPRS